MHLPKSDFFKFSRGSDNLAEKGVEGPQNMGTAVNDRKDPSLFVTDEDSITISIPDGDLERIISSVTAGWILLLYRYQRDTFEHFSWEWETSEAISHGFSVDTLGIGALKDVAELLNSIVSNTSRIVLQDKVAGDQRLTLCNGKTEGDWDFKMNIAFQGRNIHATAEWKAPTMAKHQAQAQLRIFGEILSSILDNAKVQLSEILEVSPAELEQLWSWNTPVPSTINQCMHDLIQQRAVSQPEKLGVESWDGNLSYAEIDQYSTELAQNLLLLMNTTPEHTIIPLLFEKSRWTIIALLAVMKAGAAFALLDPSQPEGRLRTIVEQTSATLLITSEDQAKLGARIASPHTMIVPISQRKFTKLYHPFASGQPATSLPPVPPSNPLYIQFTSGSTGKPKGVVISHSNYTSGAIPRAEKVGYQSHSRVLDFASYAFDVSIDCMLCTLAQGGTLCTPSEEKRINDLTGAIRDLDVNMAHMTPSVARVLDPNVMARLEILGLGGETVSAKDAAAWGEKCKVVIAYGPSECTVGCTINNEVGGRPYTTIGKGVGATIWIVNPDDHDRLVPPGAVGELLVEGPIVGIGYLGEEEKTKEVYIEDPAFLRAGSATKPGRNGRLYKTGDLVRYDPDGRGEIVFVGRGDQQVKLRGQRVELAEIEFNIRRYLPSGTEVAAEVIKPGGSGNPTLVAFLAEERKNGRSILDGNIFSSFSTEFQTKLANMERKLAEELPAYMVPAIYIPLHVMPQLVSCKTDRKRLRQIGTEMSRKDLAHFTVNQTDYTRRPMTELELRVQKLWAQVLGGEVEYRVDDNFFTVGGDSLRAMKLVAAARSDGVSLTVANVMLHPTLSGMASTAQLIQGTATEAEVASFSLLGSDLSADTARAEAARYCDLAQSSIEDVYPCTPLQEGLMALSAKFNDAYVAQRVVDLPDTETALKLQDAFQWAAKEFPILRTRIINIPGHGLFQVVVTENDYVDTAHNLAIYLEKDRAESMDLGKPLVRYGIVASSETTSAHFVLTIHHALYDGWSMPLVVDRVNRAYQGMRTKRPASFKDFIKYLTGLDRSSSEQYWRGQLQGASPHQFPPLPEPGYITQADSLLEHYVRVPQLSSTKHTLATVIRAAWALVASAYLGSPDIVYGETLTGRSAPVPGIEQIEGPMITTVPVRVRVNANSTISSLLDTLHNQSVQQIPHEHYGLQHIRRLSPEAREACELRTGLVLHPKTDEDANPFLDIGEAPANGFVPADDSEAAREALKFNTYALMLVCTLDSDGFLVMASFDSQCIDKQVMERVLKVFDAVTRKLSESPQSRITDVVSLGEEEQEDARRIRPQGITMEAPLESSASDAPPTAMHANDVPEADLAKQQKLRELWSHLLNIPESEIAFGDSFFQLGGDSIAAMKLVSEARLSNLKLNVSQIFKNRTLGAMASVVEAIESAAVEDKAIVPFATVKNGQQAFDSGIIRPLLADSTWHIKDVLAVRPLQEIAVNATVSLPRYSVRYELLHFAGEVDKVRLFAACQELVARNEILRTVFVEHSDRTLAVVLESLTAPTDEISVEGDFIPSVQEFCSRDIQRPQPYGSSFVSFTLLMSSTGESCLAFRISHAQYDEVCLPLLLQQFSALYSGTIIPDTAPFSIFTNNTVLRNIPISIPYWRNLLSGSHMSVLKSSIAIHDRTPSAVYRDFDISKRPSDITIATLPTAAWALVLSKRLRLEDVVFGEVVSGRNAEPSLPNSDKIIGPCWQYVPVRITFQPGWTHRDLLSHVQAQHIESAAFEGMDLSEIVNECTDWDPNEVTWFDSVVHQAMVGTSELNFGSAVKATCETVYPHAEPLKEWKVQAFVEGDVMRIEIVTFKDWIPVAEELLSEMEQAFAALLGQTERAIVV